MCRPRSISKISLRPRKDPSYATKCNVAIAVVAKVMFQEPVIAPRRTGPLKGAFPVPPHVYRKDTDLVMWFFACERVTCSQLCCLSKKCIPSLCNRFQLRVGRTLTTSVLPSWHWHPGPGLPVAHAVGAGVNRWLSFQFTRDGTATIRNRKSLNNSYATNIGTTICFDSTIYQKCTGSSPRIIYSCNSDRLAGGREGRR